MDKFRIASLAVISWFMVLETVFAQFTVYQDVMTGIPTTIEDLDPDDGVDFAAIFGNQFTLKFGAFDCYGVVSNEVVDGGSKTVLTGPRARSLSFQNDSDGPAMLVSNTDFESRITLWDRADFGQHIVEFDVQFGESSLIWRLVADSNNGDLAYGEMFEVNSPNQNSCSYDFLPMFDDEFEAMQLYSSFEFEIDAAAKEFGGAGRIAGGLCSYKEGLVLFGDINRDERVDLLDIAPFVDRLFEGTYQIEADSNYCGVVDLLDVNLFISFLTGQ